jgi:TolB-like protein/DNA-binding SARP family transcriptional activator
MAALQLRLLGDFEARDGSGENIRVKSRKNRALLAALALAPSHAMPRDYLAGLLWSERGEAQTRSSLRQALVALRRDFQASGGAILSVRDMKVAIDPVRVEIDVVEFQRLALATDLAALRRAAALYRGELLADTHVGDPVFEEWLASERLRLADIAATVFEKLCALETGPTRIDFAKRLAALDPLREASHRILMQVYSEAGEKALALRQYEICRDILRNDLQITPSEETEALYRRLRRNEAERQKPGPTPSAAGADAAPFLSDRPLVAVLPFDNLGDPEVEGFCDGLTEDIITGLSRISAIRVVARTTMLAYKRRAIDIRVIAREVGAQYVLEGSVRTSGKATRVSAQLIEAASGHHVWAQQIDREEADIFELQDGITRSIVASAQTQIILSEGRLQATGSDTDRIAQSLARSWQRFLGLTEESLADSRALAERALALSGRSGMAHRMCAVALYHQIYMGFIPWTEQTIDAIYTHAKISIESEGADEYSHWAMECAHLLRKEHELAAASLRRALEINPNCSLAFGSMGTVLAWGGHCDASVESNQLALRLNPQDPSNFFRHFGLALAHYLAGRYDKAVAHARMVVQARPAWWLAGIVYAASLAQSERVKEAARILAELRPVGPEINASSLAVLPFANPSDREHLERGLSKAGFRAASPTIELG